MAQVALVVTQPDRPAGRSGEPVPSPVARLAAERGIPVEKPPRLRDNAAFLERLGAAAPDIAVVVAYGKTLPDAILELPRLACVNVHASLLPRHRGASPIQAALLAGDRETGVSTMRIVEEIDAGPVYLEQRVAIGPREDAVSLSARLAESGAALLVETLKGIEAGTLSPRPQEGPPTYSRAIRREDGEADWNLPAPDLERRLLAFTPWPGLFTFLDGERVKILEARARPARRAAEPGAVWREDGELLAAAGEGTALELCRLQREGKKPVTGGEFAAGARLPARFGPRRK